MIEVLSLSPKIYWESFVLHVSIVFKLKRWLFFLRNSSGGSLKYQFQYVPRPRAIYPKPTKSGSGGATQTAALYKFLRWYSVKPPLRFFHFMFAVSFPWNSNANPRGWIQGPISSTHTSCSQFLFILWFFSKPHAHWSLVAHLWYFRSTISDLSEIQLWLHLDPDLGAPPHNIDW